jgi:hypothetical protein
MTLRLPADLRERFKEPFGPVYTDARSLLADAGRPVVAVGDVVTHHLRRAGHDPAVAVVDGRTEREAVDDAVRESLADAPGDRVAVANDPGTVSAALVEALVEALARDGPVVVEVDGEEDLATLPAVLAVPAGGSVVYGQPGEGMVLVRVTPEATATMRSLLARFEGDADATLAALE